jgi:hypothetical protein
MAASNVALIRHTAQAICMRDFLKRMCTHILDLTTSVATHLVHALLYVTSLTVHWMLK